MVLLIQKGRLAISETALSLFETSFYRVTVFRRADGTSIFPTLLRNPSLPFRTSLQSSPE